MKLLVLTALLVGIFKLVDLPYFLAAVATKAQLICLEIEPNLTSEKDTLSALVCGQKISDETSFMNLRATGLIHIFVISAGHLVVLSQILLFLKTPRLCVSLILFFFTLMTGWQAPCVRSLIGAALGFYFSKQKNYLSAPQLVFFTGLLTLALFPDWCSSLSLQLSWAAALALSLASTFRNKNYSDLQHLILTSALVFLVLLPFMQSLGGVHPLSIIWNITLGSVTALLLFPLSVLSFVSPFCLELLEKIMKAFWWSLRLSHDFKFEPVPATSSLVRGWIWIFSLHLVLHLSAIFYQRNYKT